MEVKIFSTYQCTTTDNTLEGIINRWLKENQTIEVLQILQSESQAEIGGNSVTITIFFHHLHTNETTTKEGGL